MTTEEFFRKQKEIFAFEGSEAELEAIWRDIFTPMSDHIFLARQLAQNHPMACISNISETHIAFLEENYDFFPLFRERIYSCRVGCLKPDPRIYNHALERMQADRFESLFIDDNEANILAASKMGWQTIHLRPDVSLKDALLSYDLKVV
jgi:HAD superfamily hydrolase (TIGR01509 family)